MNSGGHFAAIITEGLGNELAHKTFHRYVVRAKAGGRQSVKDKSTGKAKSGGAQIRRHNEAALAAEIAALLTSWEGLLSTCGLVFVFAPGPSSHAVFSTDSPLARGDPRVRGVPFSLHRPTLSEARRVHHHLCSMLTPEELPSLVPSAAPDQEGLAGPRDTIQEEEGEYLGADPAAPAGGAVPSVSPPSSDGIALSPLGVDSASSDAELFALHRGAQSSDHDALSRAFTAAREEGEEVLAAMLRVLDGEGKSPLHHAALCSGGAGAAMVGLLLDGGADPTVLDSHGMTPYTVAATKGIRNAFRFYRGRFPAAWDYEAAKVPEALTALMQEEKKAREKAAKKAKEKDKKKKKQEEKSRLEAESAAKAEADERLRLRKGPGAQAGDGSGCDQCGKILGKGTPFTRLEFKYCSVPCVHIHRQALDK